MRSYAIVPAAGHSVRMGRPKLTLPWGDSTVVERLLDAWLASGVGQIVVVARRDDLRLAELLKPARRRDGRIHLATPTVDPPDMKASVRCGLEYVREHWTPAANDAWLLAPADMPRLSTAAIDRLLAEHARPLDAASHAAAMQETASHAAASQEAAASAILVPTCGGRRGHPVLFPWTLADDVARLADDEGINALLKRRSVREIAWDEPSICEDLDTPDDYERSRPRE